MFMGAIYGKYVGTLVCRPPNRPGIRGTQVKSSIQDIVDEVPRIPSPPNP